MKKIVVIFNGGTISMKVDESIKAAVPSLTGEEIMSMVTGISEVAEVESFNFSHLPSPHMTVECMHDLYKIIDEMCNREDVDGIVLTHGTDTLEETAYFLDLLLETNKPVVITGAMRSSSELGYDGPANLAESICTAISEEAIGRGVLICMNGELNQAYEVTKSNSMSLNAFTCPNFGPVGIVDNNRVIFYRDVKREDNFKIVEIERNVALIKCVAGMDNDILDFYIDKGYKGIVIEALGRGNVPPSMVSGIERAIESNIPVVIVSRCFEGRVFQSYGYNGGGKHLRNLGVIFGDNLPGQKARIKLIVALSAQKNIKEVRECFEKQLY